MNAQTGILIPERMRQTLLQCLDRHQFSGSITELDADNSWVCICWEEVGPKWLAVAVGQGETVAAARAHAEELLVEEMAKHGNHPQVGRRIRKSGL